ncbi:CPBP family intramembrane glutamic endopeptidase [Nocardioides sp. YIM 152588]|uniref:CPBP family intramembrane glutamic endopeptidase n=1 Tax=Nocardioides sp. YIM 152588 TaxID=3158259 RepID=UPI0032E3D61F
MRTPRPLTALIVFGLYLVAFYGVWAVTGVEYDDIGDSASTLAKWYVAPLAASAVVLAVATTVLGWWRPVLSETQRSAPWWCWIPAAFMLAAVLAYLLTGDFESSASYLLLLAAGSIGVGFVEETATRGVLITGFRGRYTEPVVWFWSCALFGLLHLPNWAFGLGPGAVGQVVLAFMAGSALYLLRRASGSLLPAMALHALWDFGTIGGEVDSQVVQLLPVINGLLALVLGVAFIVTQRGLRVPVAGWTPPGTAAQADAARA